MGGAFDVVKAPVLALVWAVDAAWAFVLFGAAVAGAAASRFGVVRGEVFSLFPTSFDFGEGVGRHAGPLLLSAPSFPVPRFSVTTAPFSVNLVLESIIKYLCFVPLRVPASLDPHMEPSDCWVRTSPRI